MSAVSGPQYMQQAELAAASRLRHRDACTDGIHDTAPTTRSSVSSRMSRASFRCSDSNCRSSSRAAGSSMRPCGNGSSTIVYGAKAAPFNTYRAQVMLEAAARSARRKDLVVVTGNDDRIVADLGGRFPVQGRAADGHDGLCRWTARALCHRHARCRAAGQVPCSRRREGKRWRLPVSEKELAHIVNMCNGALFDARMDFANSVWGVKYRLTSLGLLPGPYCFHENGRNGLAEEIDRAYGVPSRDQ